MVIQVDPGKFKSVNHTNELRASLHVTSKLPRFSYRGKTSYHVSGE